MKINANDQLDLKGSCLSGCDKESSIFTYNLFMLNSSSNQWISFTNNSYYFYTGLNPQTDLTIKERFDDKRKIIPGFSFSNYLESGIECLYPK
jgi:hypothetical protein